MTTTLILLAGGKTFHRGPGNIKDRNVVPTPIIKSGPVFSCQMAFK
jgi:hypothetical protein